ncbi:MAG: RHS repeat-associated core domain-containing protein [Terriglobia bacterium]
MIGLRTALSQKATFTAANTIQTWNGSSAAYDHANHLTENPVSAATIRWDARGQMISDGGAQFYYDAFGRRYAATPASQGTTNYLYDGYAAIQASSGNELDTYMRVPGSGEVLSYSTTVNGTTTILVPIHDRLGSTIALIDPVAGTIHTFYVYDPYGNVTVVGTPSNFPFLFAGMEYDSTTGLYHTQSRYYSPQLQRFLSDDPKGVKGGSANFPIYVSNDPINRVDRFGEDGGWGPDPMVGTQLGGVYAVNPGTPSSQAPVGLYESPGLSPGAPPVEVSQGGGYESINQNSGTGNQQTNKVCKGSCSSNQNGSSNFGRSNTSVINQSSSSSSSVATSNNGSSGGQPSTSGSTLGATGASTGEDSCKDKASSNFSGCLSYSRNAMGVVAAGGVAACGAGVALSGGAASGGFVPCANAAMGMATGFGITATARCYQQYQAGLANCGK